MVSPAPLRVLVVDDSAYNRKNISDILNGAGDIEVVGKAGDGDEALRTRLAAQARRHHARSRVAEDGRLHVPSHPDEQAADAAHRGDELQQQGERLQGARARRRRLRRQARPAIPARRPDPQRDPEQGAPGPQPAPADAAVRADLGDRCLTQPRRRCRAGWSPRYVVGIASSTGGLPALLEIFTRPAESFPGDDPHRAAICRTSSPAPSPSASTREGALPGGRGAGQRSCGRAARLRLPRQAVHGISRAAGREASCASASARRAPRIATARAATGC